MTKSSSILAAARERIESGECVFICHALENLQDEKRVRQDDMRRLQGHVSGLIRPSDTYASWVGRTHPELVRASLIRGTYNEDWRAGLLAWLDHMIAEFKANGD